MSASFGDVYSVKVPVVAGDVHQARQEAVRLILLEAGQSGQVKVTTNSAMVGMELAETVRWQSQFKLGGFKIIREAVDIDGLTLVADISKQDSPIETCPAPLVRVRNLEYIWQRSSLDLEAETLFRLTMKQKMAQAFPLALVEETPTNVPAPYRLFAKIEGSHRFFSRNLKLVMTFVGADGTLIQQTTFSFEHADVTAIDAKNIGGATIKQLVLSDKTKQLLAEASKTVVKQFDCFPVVAAVPAGLNVVQTSSDLVDDQFPTLIFSKSWPVATMGQLDLLRLETILYPIKSDLRSVTLRTPSAAGFVLFQ